MVVHCSIPVDSGVREGGSKSEEGPRLCVLTVGEGDCVFQYVRTINLLWFFAPFQLKELLV